MMPEQEMSRKCTSNWYWIHGWCYITQISVMLVPKWDDIQWTSGRQCPAQFYWWACFMSWATSLRSRVSCFGIIRSKVFCWQTWSWKERLRRLNRHTPALGSSKGSASVVPADSDSVVPADSVSVVPAAVWVVRSTTVPQWHLKQITYWRSRIAHAAYTSWSWWHWCCKKIYSIERKCNVQVKPCSVLIWYCRKSMPHFNVSSVNTLRMGCRSDLLYVIITTPPHPTPPHPLVLCILKSVLFRICTLSAPPHPTPPHPLVLCILCWPVRHQHHPTPPHPTPPL